MFIPVTLELLKGFGQSINIFVMTLLLSLPLGMVVCLGSMSKFAPLKALTRSFVWVIRGTPLMLQLILIFYGPGLMFQLPSLPRFTAVIIAFSINYACYFSEIYRGGIESIPHGQYEAGKVLGMTRFEVFRKVVLLQVVKRVIPPMSNEIITLLKDTALASVVVHLDLFTIAKEIVNLEVELWPLFYSAAFYLIFTAILTFFFGWLEKKLDYFKA
jgi:polar amino acid transport system permease protein